MTAPTWLNSVIGDFARSAGLSGLEFNERGAAALKFETGCTLRLEYTGEELVIAMTLPLANLATGASLPLALKRLLSISHPKAEYGFRVRTGYMAKTGNLIMAVRLAERDVTLPRVNGVFTVLWRLTGEIGGSSWA